MKKQMALGLAALGRPGYINLGHADDLNSNYSIDAMRDHAHQVLDAAWDAGVRYFDAARSYGQSEAFLATWLQRRKIPSDEVTIASKWGYFYTADWQVNVPNDQAHEVKQHSLDRLDQQWLETAELLGEHLDLYQIHSATLESGVLKNRAVLDRLGQLRDQGMRIGLSVSGPVQADVIRQAIDVEADSRPLFSAVQATWNLLEPSAAEALQAASRCGWWVIIKEAVANGRLTGRNVSPAFARQRQLLIATAERLDTTIDALALAIAYRQPWTNVVLSGAAASEHLHSNLTAQDVCNLVDDELAEELINQLRETPADYWQTRSNLAWN